MSLTRSQIEDYHLARSQMETYRKLPFHVKVQLVLNIYNERINQMNAFPATLFKKDYNVYFSMITSIRDYLAAYLTKNANDDFERILKEGYQKYDQYSPGDYIPTFALCKDDPLSLYDLDCAVKIVKKSIFLSNNDFIEDIRQLASEKYALTQYEIDHNPPDIVNELKDDTFSNGFKYYVEGILFEQKNKWTNLFNNNAHVPEYVDLGVLLFGLLTSGGSLVSLFRGGILPMIALTITLPPIIYLHGCLSDKIAVTFFSGKKSTQEVNTQEIIQDVPTQKQHITPLRGR